MPRPARNVAHYCDPAVDSLIETAIRTREGAGQAWHTVLRRIEDDAPAVFMYAPSYVFAVNRRFTNVRIRPESSWLGSARMDGRPRQGARRPAGTDVRRWLLRRALQALVTLAVALVLLFFLMRLARAIRSAAWAKTGRSRPQQIQALRERYGLDRPLLEQLWTLRRRARPRGPRHLDRVRPPGHGADRSSGCRPPSCSAARCCCSTSPSGSGSACGRPSARTAAEDRWLTTVLARRIRDAVVLAGPGAGLAGGREVAAPPSGRDAESAARTRRRLWHAAADVARHLVLPALTLSVVSIAGDHALPAERPCWRSSAFLIY